MREFPTGKRLKALRPWHLREDRVSMKPDPGGDDPLAVSKAGSHSNWFIVG